MPRMDTIRSFFTTVGTRSGGQIPPALHDLARRALRGHPVVDDAEACRDVVQSLVARAIGDVRAGRPRAWRQLGTMDDGALAGVLKHRLRQTASEQDPLRLERHALSQHVRHALAASVDENASPPTGLTDRFGRFSHPLIKDAVAWALASSSALERSTRAVTNHLVHKYLPRRERDASPDDWSADADLADPETDMRRSIDGPRMARDLVTLLTPRVARVISMSLDGATYDQISISEGIPLGTLHRWVKKAEVVIGGYSERVFLTSGTMRYVFRLIARARETQTDRRIRHDIKDTLTRELERRAPAKRPKPL